MLMFHIVFFGLFTRGFYNWDDSPNCVSLYFESHKKTVEIEKIQTPKDMILKRFRIKNISGIPRFSKRDGLQKNVKKHGHSVNSGRKDWWFNHFLESVSVASEVFVPGQKPEWREWPTGLLLGRMGTAWRPGRKPSEKPVVILSGKMWKRFFDPEISRIFFLENRKVFIRNARVELFENAGAIPCTTGLFGWLLPILLDWGTPLAGSLSAFFSHTLKDVILTMLLGNFCRTIYIYLHATVSWGFPELSSISIVLSLKKPIQLLGCLHLWKPPVVCYPTELL